MLLQLRHPRMWLAIGWVLVVFAILGSLLPTASLPPTGVNDKFEHSFSYIILSLWFAGIYPRSRYLVIAAALFVMGAAIEWAQGAMNLGRQSDARDMLANLIGISVGLGIALLWLGGWAQRLEAWAQRLQAWARGS